MKIFSAVVLASMLVLVGAGCTKQPVTVLPTVPPAGVSAAVANGSSGTDVARQGEGSMMPDKIADAPAKAAAPYYIAYSAAQVDAAMAAGRPVLLYFYAAWCPICRDEEPKLQKLVQGSATAVAGFRVDYDTEKGLKSAFKVPYQHTTIILTAKGVESARFTGPMSATELESALVAASR